jgi:hypothetical protein
MTLPSTQKTGTLPPEIDTKNIKKMYLAKFGNLYIFPEKDFRIDHDLLFKKIIECLDSSPLVTRTERVTARHQPTQLVYGERMTSEMPSDVLEGISFTPYIMCEIHCPVKNQLEIKVDGLFASASNIDATDTFSLIYNGSIYIVFREADPTKPSHPGAADIRNFLEDIFGKQPKVWKTKTQPPNPLREDVYFVFLEDLPETRPLIGRSFQEKDSNRLYTCLPESGLKNFKQFMGICLFTVSFDLDIFYQTAFQHDNVEAKRDRLELNQRSLRKTIQDIQQLSFFNFYKHYRKSRELERSVSEHFLNMVDYSLACEHLGKRAEKVRHYLAKDVLLHYFGKSLMDEIIHEKSDIESLAKCANYLSDSTQKSYANKITILAALLTIIGSVAGSILIDYLRSILH